MGTMTFKTILLGAASAVVLSAGSANAALATAETSLNLRSGPGTQYRVVGTIAAGTTVDVGGCTGSWCRVSFSGGSGFANRSYLAMGGGGAAVAVAPGYVYEDSPSYADDYYDYGYAYGPSFGFYVSPRHRFHHGGRGGQWDRGHAWNGGGGGPRWNGGTPGGGRPGGGWAGRPGGPSPGIAPGGVTPRQGFAGAPRGGASFGANVSRAGMAGAPAGMRTGGGGMGGGGFRGGGPAVGAGIGGAGGRGQGGR
jgi:hypothetical protein